MQKLKNVPDTPAPLGPYCSGTISSGPFLFVSGQGPYDPDSGKIDGSLSVAEQTRLTLNCVDRVLKAGGSDRSQVVSCRVFLSELNESTFAEMNAVYDEFFGDHTPARTTVGSALLNIDVEIDCIAQIPSS